MRNFELQASLENVVKTFEEDLWGRNADVRAFVELLDTIDESCSIAVDARWGSGKTFFVKQAKVILDAYNIHATKMAEEVRTRVLQAYNKLGLTIEYELQPQVAVYYDAWANDNDEDPALSLVYSIMQSIHTTYDFKNGVDCLKLAAIIGEWLSGTPLTDIMEALKQDDPLAHMFSQKDLQDKINEFFDSILPERGNRLVVFIDELDRCKPTFAVRLLERIKHYFCNDRITFVFSVNISELQHTIKKHYGNDFDAGRYLDRFFDIPISLPPIDVERFYRQIGLLHGDWLYEAFCKSVIDAYNFTPREIMKFYKMARTAAYKPNHQDSNGVEFAFDNGRARKFGLMFVVPVMIGLRIAEFSRYIHFIEGKDGSPMREILAGTKSLVRYYEDLLTENETFSDKPLNDTQKTVKLSEKLNQVYNAIFVQNYDSGTRKIKIGNMEFGPDIKTMLVRVVSTLSPYADYNI